MDLNKGEAPTSERVICTLMQTLCLLSCSQLQLINAGSGLLCAVSANFEFVSNFANVDHAYAGLKQQHELQ